MLAVSGPLCGTKDAVRYFGFARHALIEGFRAMNIGSGARVLLPEFICRDVLASVHAVGATALFYPVDMHLQPATSPVDWPRAEAVLAVDYFGFAQPLAPFREYCEKWSACLIEDNAHGFLSRDESGDWLGLRGDAGLFSLRKTFLMVNGAALVMLEKNFVSKLDSQLASVDMVVPSSLRIRRTLRRLTGSRRPELMLAEALRWARCWRNGHAIAAPDRDAEMLVSGAKAPSNDLFNTLAKQDFYAEIERRRSLYLKISQLAQNNGCQLVFPVLPTGVAPYGLPVYCTDIISLKGVVRRFGLDCFRWPDLPDAVAPNAPSHYRDLHVINFL